MIGGNTVATLQRLVHEKNELRETVTSYKDVMVIKGFLDRLDGDSNYLNLNSKTLESTHVFICDHVHIHEDVTDLVFSMNGHIFDVKDIDNPMGMNQHLEIYLKYRGKRVCQ